MRPKERDILQKKKAIAKTIKAGKPAFMIHSYSTEI
jgi:hypothetical protein